MREPVYQQGDGPFEEKGTIPLLRRKVWLGLQPATPPAKDAAEPRTPVCQELALLALLLLLFLAARQLRPLSLVVTCRPEDVPDGPLYVHLDADVIDPAEVPGLRFPAPGGPSAAQIAGALRLLLGTGRVAAVGMACSWHPGHGAAARLAPHLQTAFGIPG